MAGILETLVEWLVSVSQWFNDWDITILVPALIILTVIAGVTGLAATGPRLWMQLVWGHSEKSSSAWSRSRSSGPLSPATCRSPIWAHSSRTCSNTSRCSSQNKCRGWACVAAMGIVGKSHRHSSVDIGPTSVVCLPVGWCGTQNEFAHVRDGESDLAMLRE